MHQGEGDDRQNQQNWDQPQEAHHDETAHGSLPSCSFKRLLAYPKQVDGGLKADPGDDRPRIDCSRKVQMTELFYSKTPGLST
jgi:hypothetical protein